MRTIMYKLVNPIVKRIRETNTSSVEEVMELQKALIIRFEIFRLAYEEQDITWSEYLKLYSVNIDTIDHISRTLYLRTYNVEDLCYHYRQLFK